jgi:lipopolysaccharide transport system permease protein
MNDNAIKELWQYKELVYFMVWRDFKIRYKQTILGAAWAVIQPLVTTLVFFLLFGKLARMPSDDIPYPVFTYLGMMAWTYFSGSISYSSNSLVSNSGLISKVYFPRLILPLSGILSLLPDLLISAVVGIGLMLFFNIIPSAGILLWPLMIIPMIMISLGVSLILSALNVRFRDIRYVIPFLVQIWLFLTPIIYPTSIIPERLRILSYFNPMTGVIDGLRMAALPGRTVSWLPFSISTVVGLLLLLCGIAIFKREEHRFADII